MVLVTWPEKNVEKLPCSIFAHNHYFTLSDFSILGWQPGTKDPHAFDQNYFDAVSLRFQCKCPLCM